MELDAILDSLDGVAEPMRGLYAEKEGKFVLKLKGAPTGYVPTSKLDEFRRNNIELQKKQKAVEETLGGMSLEDVAALIAKANAGGDGKGDGDKGGDKGGAADFEKLRQALIAQHDKERGKLAEENGKVTRAVERYVARAAILQALVENGANKTGRSVLPEFVLKNVKIERDENEDGELEFSVVPWDAKNKQARLKNAQGERMSLREYIAELKASDEYAGAFEGSGASGSGARGSSQRGGASGSGSVDFSIPPVERLRASRKAQGTGGR